MSPICSSLIFLQRASLDLVEKNTCSTNAEAQLTNSTISRGYRKFCGAIMIFALVARLAKIGVTFYDHVQGNIKNIIIRHISCPLVQLPK